MWSLLFLPHCMFSSYLSFSSSFPLSLGAAVIKSSGSGFVTQLCPSVVETLTSVSRFQIRSAFADSGLGWDGADRIWYSPLCAAPHG